MKMTRGVTKDYLLYFNPKKEGLLKTNQEVHTAFQVEPAHTSGVVVYDLNTSEKVYERDINEIADVFEIIKYIFIDRELEDDDTTLVRMVGFHLKQILQQLEVWYRYSDLGGYYPTTHPIVAYDLVEIFTGNVILTAEDRFNCGGEYMYTILINEPWPEGENMREQIALKVARRLTDKND